MKIKTSVRKVISVYSRFYGKVLFVAFRRTIIDFPNLSWFSLKTRIAQRIKFGEVEIPKY